MIRRLPLVPTLVVLAAVAVMIGLGIWQLRRAGEKEALLARFEASAGQAPVGWPGSLMTDDQLPLFRRATGMCLQPMNMKVVAGRNLQGESGYSHLVDCRTGAEGPGMRVDIGWSKDPRTKSDWRGGPVDGVIAPDSELRMRLISAQGLSGLQASAPPSPENIPNNHRSYAIQWFLFAALALGIYLLAVRGREAKALK
jgi:surfeit locus 1 family protein